MRVFYPRSQPQQLGGIASLALFSDPAPNVRSPPSDRGLKPDAAGAHTLCPTATVELLWRLTVRHVARTTQLAGHIGYTVDD